MRCLASAVVRLLWPFIYRSATGRVFDKSSFELGKLLVALNESTSESFLQNTSQLDVPMPTLAWFCLRWPRRKTYYPQWCFVTESKTSIFNQNPSEWTISRVLSASQTSSVGDHFEGCPRYGLVGLQQNQFHELAKKNQTSIPPTNRLPGIYVWHHYSIVNHLTQILLRGQDVSSRRIYIKITWYLVYIRIYLYKTNLKYVITQRLNPIAFPMWKNHKGILASKNIQIQESQGSSERYIRIPKQELRDHEHLLVLRWHHRVWVSEPGRRHALTAGIDMNAAS